MTDEQIIEAVRSGTHALVPMPIGKRKFFVGYIKDAGFDDEAFGVFVDLWPSQCEGEDVIAHDKAGGHILAHDNEGLR